MRGDASANATAVHFKLNEYQKAAERFALASFGKRGRGDFDLWSDDDEQGSDSSASIASITSPLPPSASNTSCLPPSASNASRLPPSA